MMLTGETKEQQERRLREDNAWAGEIGMVLKDEAPDDVTPDELAGLRLQAQAKLSKELAELSGTTPNGKKLRKLRRVRRMETAGRRVR